MVRPAGLIADELTGRLSIESRRQNVNRIRYPRLCSACVRSCRSRPVMRCFGSFWRLHRSRRSVCLSASLRSGPRCGRPLCRSGGRHDPPYHSTTYPLCRFLCRCANHRALGRFGGSCGAGGDAALRPLHAGQCLAACRAVPGLGGRRGDGLRRSSRGGSLPGPDSRQGAPGLRQRPQRYRGDRLDRTGLHRQPLSAESARRAARSFPNRRSRLLRLPAALRQRRPGRRVR